jgi:hypothetical protein
MPDNDAALAVWLSTNDAPCPVCTYNLRGLGVPRCTECSAPLHLCVGSDNLIAAPWVIAVLSFGLGIGFDSVVGLILTVMLTVSFFVEGGPPPGLFQVFIAIAAGFWTLVGLGVLAIWLLFRRRRPWLRRPPRSQWRMAVLIFVSVGLVHLCYGAAVVFVMQRF